MSWNKYIRKAHRWISMIFTLTVVANFATMAFGQPPAWVVYSPLLPLFLLLGSGLYLFALPYIAPAADKLGAKQDAKIHGEHRDGF